MNVKKKFKSLLLKFALPVCAASTLLVAGPAHAMVSPLSVSIIPPVQFPPSEFTVAGARVSALWGNHRDVYGLDVGLLGNVTQGNFVGIAVSGLFNITHGMTNAIGMQLAGITNINTQKTSVYGLQLALGVNANEAQSKIVGLQIAAIANLSQFTDIYGVQIGIYNRAQDVYGFQIGLVNVASSLHGVQIGLANINQKGLFEFSPILNIGF